VFLVFAVDFTYIPGHERAFCCPAVASMQLKSRPALWAVVLSLAVHGLVLLLLGRALWPTRPNATDAPVPVEVKLAPPAPSKIPSPPARTASTQSATTPAHPQAPATQDAPPAPSAEDWAFAGRYTLKNSKGYRHNWGRQVRSMMGTAVEGPDQGMVRFRIEIAPNGTLAKLETLWSTSPVAEQKAREAIAHMPALPPTPTGKPLVFEKTIVFSPFASDDTPLYRHDCDPEVPAFRNPFVWNGQSDKWRDDDPPPVKVLTGQELEDCRKQLPAETVQSEAARDKRVMDRWGTVKSGRPGAPD
jgi:hypothetical protein